MFVNLARNGSYFLRKLLKIVVTVTIFAVKEIGTVTLHFIILRIAGPKIVVSILTHKCAKNRYLIRIQSASYFSMGIKNSKKRNGNDAKILII